MKSILFVLTAKYALIDEVITHVSMGNRLINTIILPLLGHFTILGQKNAQNMPRYYTVEQGKNMD